MGIHMQIFHIPSRLHQLKADRLLLMKLNFHFAFYASVALSVICLDLLKKMVLLTARSTFLIGSLGDHFLGFEAGDNARPSIDSFCCFPSSPLSLKYCQNFLEMSKSVQTYLKMSKKSKSV